MSDFLYPIMGQIIMAKAKATDSGGAPAANTSLLFEPTQEFWEQTEAKDRQEHLETMFNEFEARSKGVFTDADSCADEANQLAKRFRNWRITIMVVAGGLAILN